MLKNILRQSIFILLTMTLLIRCCTSKPKPVSVDYYAYKYVKHFQKEAIEEGIDISTIKDSIDDIVFYPLKDMLYGVYVPSNRQIVINSRVDKDTIILKKVIYHELGHLYGLKHDVGGIMQTNMSDELLHRLYCPLENKYGKENWVMHKAYLFFKIRQHLKDLDKSE